VVPRKTSHYCLMRTPRTLYYSSLCAFQGNVTLLQKYDWPFPLAFQVDPWSPWKAHLPEPGEPYSFQSTVGQRQAMKHCTKKTLGRLSHRRFDTSTTNARVLKTFADQVKLNESADKKTLEVEGSPWKCHVPLYTSARKHDDVASAHTHLNKQLYGWQRQNQAFD
jgi:hypothetical protein